MFIFFEFGADGVFLVHKGSSQLLTGISTINSAGIFADTYSF